MVEHLQFFFKKIMYIHILSPKIALILLQTVSILTGL